MKKTIVALLALSVAGCALFFFNSQAAGSFTAPKRGKAVSTKILNAGFVCVEKVYNSELMAPYDVLQHSLSRDSTNYIRCFIVTPDGKPFVTFESS